MKIYIITKGDYSSYHICAVSTDKKNAETLRKAFSDRWDEARIETYESDEFLTEIENGFKLYDCSMKEDGDMSITIFESSIDYYIDSANFKVKKYKKGYMAPGYGVYVWAKDKDHARKIAADKIAEFKAKEEGV